jgi:hypothetical protein
MTSSIPPEETLGEVAVMVESLTTSTLVAPVAPKVTDVAPEKPVPLIVTLVPPDVGPEFGETPVTVGTGPEGVPPPGTEVSTRPPVLLDPTAVQVETEVHVTPARRSPTSLGLGTTDQAVPSHCSMRGPEVLGPRAGFAVELKPPTAVQVEAEVHEIPVSESEL